jgi:hypothetical protein
MLPAVKWGPAVPAKHVACGKLSGLPWQPPSPPKLPAPQYVNDILKVGSLLGVLGPAPLDQVDILIELVKQLCVLPGKHVALGDWGPPSVSHILD